MVSGREDDDIATKTSLSETFLSKGEELKGRIGKWRRMKLHSKTLKTTDTFISTFSLNGTSSLLARESRYLSYSSILDTALLVVVCWRGWMSAR